MFRFAMAAISLCGWLVQGKTPRGGHYVTADGARKIATARVSHQARFVALAHIDTWAAGA